MPGNSGRCIVLRRRLRLLRAGNAGKGQPGKEWLQTCWGGINRTCMGEGYPFDEIFQGKMTYIGTVSVTPHMT